MKLFERIRKFFEPEPLPTFTEWCAANGYSTDPTVNQVFVVPVKIGDDISDMYGKGPDGTMTEEQNARALAALKHRLLCDSVIREGA